MTQMTTADFLVEALDKLDLWTAPRAIISVPSDDFLWEKFLFWHPAERDTRNAHGKARGSCKNQSHFRTHDRQRLRAITAVMHIALTSNNDIQIDCGKTAVKVFHIRPNVRLHERCNRKQIAFAKELS